ncbi:universal stress protein [Varibaculum massiliense]|uniref:universal stress protein n=1 Tax=Varibaculum massiliense TaxID=1852372 RepID=UPI0008D98D5D|nr:universal stress protein [Varibaculum massiliense]
MSGKETILVGVDGSPESLEAAEWAGVRAQQSGSKLQVLCAYALPSYTAASMDSGFAVVDNDAIRESAQTVVDEAISHLNKLGYQAEGRVEAGDPTAILVQLSQQVDLIVVGTRGGGGFTDRLLGATSSALPAYSRCPVVVVPRRGGADDQFVPVKKIVIGFDGSTRSRKSLRRSIKEAQVWGAELTAVDAVPLASSAGILSWLPATVDRDSILRDVRDQLKQTCQEETAGSGVKVHSHALDGNPAALLTEFSTAVDLVVVGTRGGGGFAGALMGSTSQSILAHAACPVLVVPTGDRESGAEE